MDVVIVTLDRPTLSKCIEAIQQSIPNPHFIFIEGQGRIGELRNKGIRQVTSDIFAFIDDDIIVNKQWFNECMKYINDYDVVCGSYYPFSGVGCSLCKTEVLKKFPFNAIGGYDTINPKWNVFQTNVKCEHLNFHHIRHTMYWIGGRYQRGGIIWTFKASLGSFFKKHNFFMAVAYFVGFVNAIITKSLVVFEELK